MSTTRRSFITRAAAAGGAVAARALSGAGIATASRRRRHRIFADDFMRRDGEGWGGRWYLQRYGRHWRIERGKGVLRFPPRENSVYYRPVPVLVLDHDVADTEIQATVATTNVTARIGVLARAGGYSDFYAAYLGPGRILRVTRCGVHDERVVGRKIIPFTREQRFQIRFKVSGAGPVRLRAKAWPLGEPEPATWQVDEIDAASDAIGVRGAFGVFCAHAIDGRGTTLRVLDVKVWSSQPTSVTSPTLAYSLVGPPSSGKIGAVAQPAVPAYVGFEYGADPTFADARRARGNRAGAGRRTGKAELDISSFEPGSIVYWRAFAERRGNRVVGPTSRFRVEPEPGQPVRIAFGACTKWDPWPHVSFDQARLRQPDIYLHQGDLGYVAQRVTNHAPDCYQDHWTRMLMDPSLAALTREVPFAFYRDDTEYGINNADASTFRRFVPRAHDEMNANPGTGYFTFRYGGIAFFALDCRRYSTGRDRPLEQRYKLGEKQMTWLQEEMRQAKRDNVSMMVVASPQAFGSDVSPASWHKSYPAEWDELMDFFLHINKPVLVLSGDAHGHRLHEYPQKFMDPSVPRVVEFTSAGTEQTRFEGEPDPGIVIRDARGSAFGTVEIGPEQWVNRSRARTVTLTAVRSLDGTILWTQAYLAIHNVGIIPLGGP